MKAVFRWLLRAMTAALAGIVLAVLLAGYLIGRSIPDPDARVTLGGLAAEARVLRDRHAVPHIRAASAEDAYFTLGLVHAQDRLWQMELQRRVVQGRLSGLLGERTVPLDRLVKTLDLYGHSSRSFRHQTPETQAALEAYAAGVNAWIRHVDREALGRGAPEFFFFSEGGLAPWTPADSLAILKMMALRLTSAAQKEVRRARFLLALPAERVADILPDPPGGAKIVVPRYASLFPGARFAGADRTRPPPDPLLAALGPAPRPELGGASNAWAIDASRSAAGSPLLAADPHLWLSAPSIWYLADIQGGDLAAIGATLPGTPLVLVGRNRQLAWGPTTVGVDDQDLYIERLDPDDPGRYRTPGGWERFATRQIRIEIAGGAALQETVRATRHGPVLTHDIYGVDTVTPEGHVAALAWTALTDEDRSMSSVLALMQAGTVEDAMDAMDGVTAPAQNVILADSDDIAHVLAGALPLRNRESTSLGRVPSPGWKPENDWSGTEPGSEKIRLVSPRSGAIANTNNRITDRPFPDQISFDWDPPYRIERVSKELSAREFHSRDSFVALQNDAISEMARAVLPLIARNLWWREPAETATARGAAARRATALRLLAAWNGEMDRHAPEPLIFSEWMRQLTRKLAADELGPLMSEVEGVRPLFVERVMRDIDGAAVWCDIDKTPERESCDEIASAALDDALNRLVRDHGPEVQGWRWGAAHVAEHVHTPLGWLGPLGTLVSISQETSGGDFTLLRGATPGKGPEPFRNVHASGMRMVADFSDLDRSLMIIATGQSGHPLSRHYDDLSELWARGDMIPMSMSDEDARTGGLGTMTLVPMAR